ncbi:MAG TPA: hypothetical protein VIL94_06695 [Acidothermaceae bacterium]|jgi:hypothetical protein
MSVIASGYSIDGDRWYLEAGVDGDTGDLFTGVTIELPDGSRPWGGGCGGPPVESERHISTSCGVSDFGPRTFIARVDAEVRALVVTLSDSTREDLQLHGDISALGARVGVLVYPRHLDIHRVDVIGSNGDFLTT